MVGYLNLKVSVIKL